MLASINGTDITKCINDSTYKVVSEDVYEEWKDANYTTHRQLVRQRVVGSFEIAFAGGVTINYEDFKALLATRSRSGALAITVFVQNENASRTINAFYKMSAKKFKDLGNGYMVQIFNFEFEEA